MVVLDAQSPELTIALAVLNVVQVLGLAFIGRMFQKQNGTLKELGQANDRLQSTVDYRLAQQHQKLGEIVTQAVAPE